MSDKDSNKEHQYKINHSIADPNQEAATLSLMHISEPTRPY